MRYCKDEDEDEVRNETIFPSSLGDWNSWIGWEFSMELRVSESWESASGEVP
jgi:hypothetical protein